MTDKTEQIFGEESRETILTHDIRKLVRIKKLRTGVVSQNQRKRLFPH